MREKEFVRAPQTWRRGSEMQYPYDRKRMSREIEAAMVRGGSPAARWAWGWGGSEEEWRTGLTRDMGGEGVGGVAPAGLRVRCGTTGKTTESNGQIERWECGRLFGIKSWPVRGLRLPGTSDLVAKTRYSLTGKVFLCGLEDDSNLIKNIYIYIFFANGKFVPRPTVWTV